MTHLDETALVALRDRQDLVEDRAVGHLEACLPCATALTGVAERARLIEHALASLDEPVDDLEARRAAIRARLDQRTAADLRGGGWWRPAHLGRAAAVLLVAAGAVSALPGSPVREWLSGPPSSEVEPGVLETAPVLQEAEAAGVTVPVSSGGVRVLISSLGPLGSLEIVWSDDEDVHLDAPAGSRFSYAEGRVEALVAGGPVRIRLPREGAPVSVDVDGTSFLTRSGDQIRVTGPVVERSENRILFQAP